MFILDQLYHENTSCSATHSLGILKAPHTKGVFLTLAGHHHLPTGLQTQLSESREHLLTSTVLNLRFPCLQHISYKLPSENRDSNNLLWCSKQQRLLLEECAGLRAERTSTNSICLFWHTGRKEEPDSPEVVKNDSPAWNSE